jgi:hypothetical protein
MNTNKHEENQEPRITQIAQIRNSSVKVRVVIFVWFLRAQHAFPFETGILVISSPFDSLPLAQGKPRSIENGAAREAAT